jgi:hypothetical protein
MNLEFFNKFDKIISLGFNCFIKKFKSQVLKISEETDLFDYIGTPMWGINLFIKNNFKNLDDKSKYSNLQINIKDKIITQKDYYFRFLHDLNNDNFDRNFIEFVNKYNRRVERFLKNIKTCKKILFIRTEENNNRIKYDEYKEYYEKTEIEYLQEFTKLIKEINPKLEIKIILISKSLINNQIDNIIVLNESKDYKWLTAHNDLKFTFEKHAEFIKKLINI